MTRGTAPEITSDLRQIIDGVVAELPDVECQQLGVSHPADDDGLWYFRRSAQPDDVVQIESSTGVCPFLIETNRDVEVRWGRTPDEAVATIVALLS